MPPVRGWYLQVIDVLNQNIGLPPWAFSLALTFLLIGLPIVGVTAAAKPDT